MGRTDSSSMASNSSSVPVSGELQRTGFLALLPRRATLVPLALAAVVVSALLTRLDFFVLRGGLDADQVNWGNGGLTQYYLNMRDAILAWTAEPRPWSYLPGYPAFLAIVQIVGVKDLASVRLIQLVIDALSILPLYFALRRLGNATAAALFACLIYAIAPWWGAGSTFLLGESLLPALMILLLAGMVIVRERAANVLAWLLLGLLSSVLPFFRSDMILLVGPLIVWALLTSPKDRRIPYAVCVAAGFILPLLLWSTRNYIIHDQFLLTPPAKWYAAWSGLGQVANEFGYFVNDALAGEHLQPRGFIHNSVQSEQYWRAEYFRAWVDHPAHVIKTILFRFGRILGEPEPQGYFLGFAPAAYKWMAYATPIVLTCLIYRGRWADAFLIALPMAYALGSLGFVYVEFRYVRYAGLTYLFVLAFVLSAAGSLSLATWGARALRAKLLQLRSAVGLVLFLAVALGTLYQLRITTKAAEIQGLADRLDVSASQLPISELEDLVFQPALPSIGAASGKTGLQLQARVPAGTYLALAPLRAQAKGVAVIRYRATVQRGAIGLGILSANGDRWLSHQDAQAGANGEFEGSFVSVVETGSLLVIDARRADEGIEAVVNKLQWSLGCPTAAGFLRLFLGDKTIPARECNSARGS